MFQGQYTSSKTANDGGCPEKLTCLARKRNTSAATRPSPAPTPAPNSKLPAAKPSVAKPPTSSTGSASKRQKNDPKRADVGELPNDFFDPNAVMKETAWPHMDRLMLPRPQEWCSKLTTFDLAFEAALSLQVAFQSAIALRGRVVMKDLGYRRAIAKLVKAEADLGEAKKLVSKKETLIMKKDAIIKDWDVTIREKEDAIKDKEAGLKNMQESYDALNEVKLNMEEELELKTRVRLMKEFLDGKLSLLGGSKGSK